MPVNSKGEPEYVADLSEVFASASHWWTKQWKFLVTKNMTRVTTLLRGLIQHFVITSCFWMKSQLQEQLFPYVPDTQGQLQTILHAIPRSQFRQYLV
jgi:hypothetical protein